MAESTALFYESGGIEKLSAVNTKRKGRQGIDVNFAEIRWYGELVTKIKDFNYFVQEKINKKLQNLNKNFAIET